MVDDTVARLNLLSPLRLLKLLEEPESARRELREPSPLVVPVPVLELRLEPARRELKEPSPLVVSVPLEEPRLESARREDREPSPLLVPVPLREEPRLELEPESARREVREPNPLLVPNCRSLMVEVGAARLEPTRARTTAVFILKSLKERMI